MRSAYDILIPDPQPRPTARDYADYDGRASKIVQIETTGLRVLAVSGPQAAAQFVRRWAETYDRLRTMVEPGTPEWYRDRASR